MTKPVSMSCSSQVGSDVWKLQGQVEVPTPQKSGAPLADITERVKRQEAGLGAPQKSGSPLADIRERVKRQEAGLGAPQKSIENTFTVTRATMRVEQNEKMQLEMEAAKKAKLAKETADKAKLVKETADKAKLARDERKLKASEKEHFVENLLNSGIVEVAQFSEQIAAELFLGAWQLSGPTKVKVCRVNSLVERIIIQHPRAMRRCPGLKKALTHQLERLDFMVEQPDKAHRCFLIEKQSVDQFLEQHFGFGQIAFKPVCFVSVRTREGLILEPYLLENPPCYIKNIYFGLGSLAQETIDENRVPQLVDDYFSMFLKDSRAVVSRLASRFTNDFSQDISKECASEIFRRFEEGLLKLASKGHLDPKWEKQYQLQLDKVARGELQLEEMEQQQQNLARDDLNRVRHLFEDLRF